MTWKPIDFEGIVNLNKTIVDQLYRYLEDKETQLSQVILNTVHPYQSSDVPPMIMPSPHLKVKLSDAVEGLGKQIHQITQSHSPITDPSDWKEAVKNINHGLWEYLETLEECVTELFQQLALLGIEDWRTELAHVVQSIKEVLANRLDDLLWAIKRIESQLKDYRWASEAQQGKWISLRKMALFWSSLLDRSLISNLVKCKKFLSFSYQNFSNKYRHFNEIHAKTDQMLEKFNNYKVFLTLEEDSQNKIKKIYQLVKLWELNTKARFLPRQETVRALRNLMSPDGALSIFKEYYHALQIELFACSNMIKSQPSLVETQDRVETMQEELLSRRGELHTLGATISKYRDFLLRTDPNPYVRSRWGFPEWIVGQEPSQANQMRSLVYDIEQLDEMYEAFRQAIERKVVAPDTPIAELDGDIQAILHEMAQPLLSKAMMQLKAERLMVLLRQLDELTHINQEVVAYVGQVLGKALRADWKYHVLFSIPAFHQIYEIHHGLIGNIEERSHINRLHKFKKLIQKIGQWVKNNDTPRHTHEIELDMNDIKGYLQDFLGQVQRVAAMEGDRETASKSRMLIERQLLEYRYLFGNFFYHLREEKPEERMIRKQFLFVDQYFEAVENILHEQRLREEAEKEREQELQREKEQAKESEDREEE